MRKDLSQVGDASVVFEGVRHFLGTPPALFGVGLPLGFRRLVVTAHVRCHILTSFLNTRDKSQISNLPHTPISVKCPASKLVSTEHSLPDSLVETKPNQTETTLCKVYPPGPGPLTGGVRYF